MLGTYEQAEYHLEAGKQATRPSAAWHACMIVVAQVQIAASVFG
jgi:hypothetical protein